MVAEKGEKLRHASVVDVMKTRKIIYLMETFNREVAHRSFLRHNRPVVAMCLRIRGGCCDLCGDVT